MVAIKRSIQCHNISAVCAIARSPTIADRSPNPYTWGISALSREPLRIALWINRLPKICGFSTPRDLSLLIISAAALALMFKFVIRM